MESEKVNTVLTFISQMTKEARKVLAKYIAVCVHLCLVAQSYTTLCDPMDCSPPGSSVHEILQGKNTGVGCHFRLKGIFPTRGLNPCLLSPTLQADSLLITLGNYELEKSQRSQDLNPGSLALERGHCSLETSVLEVRSQTYQKASKEVIHIYSGMCYEKVQPQIWGLGG